MRLARWTTLGSAAGIATGLGIWLGLGRIIAVAEPAGVAERLALACAALLPTAGVAALMVLVQMLLRAAGGAVDPLAGRDGSALRVNQRVLTNTVEQLAIFAPALLALAAGAPSGWMRHTVAAAWVFALARLAFWGGYLLGPLKRAPGMAATFMVSLGTLAAAVRVWWP